ncbi:hypothetical protein [Sphaerisporangium corydalis]|uniref:DUF1579 domain-containing protein n=1 Tax=Sphaerisporangium corydalis TaxID=1441875 RepID=A0ABV9EJI0_9ACTN|nr:hypothetical protein [Sphaerisporangium corydalis]
MMRLGRLLLAFGCVLTLTAGAVSSAAVADSASAAKVTDVPTQLSAMEKLGFMVGRWAGTGWTIGSSGVRQEFLQTERVRRQVGGLVISVEGEGRDRADPRRVVDTALAVINYNDVTAQYRWEAFSQGFVTTVAPVVGDDTFQWSLQTPSTTIRYTLQFTRRTWHEIGEFTLDGGQTWRQNFQMDLVRVA